MNKVTPFNMDRIRDHRQQEEDNDQAAFDERLECEDVQLFKDPATLEKLKKIIDQLGEWKDSIKLENALTTNNPNLEPQDGEAAVTQATAARLQAASRTRWWSPTRSTKRFKR